MWMIYDDLPHVVFCWRQLEEKKASPKNANTTTTPTQTPLSLEHHLLLLIFSERKDENHTKMEHVTPQGF